MKRIICVCALLAATSGYAADQAPAPEPTITVQFTDEEASAALALWDAGLKAIGGPAAETYVVLSKKIAAAAAQPRKQ